MIQGKFFLELKKIQVLISSFEATNIVWATKEFFLTTDIERRNQLFDF